MMEVRMSMMWSETSGCRDNRPFTFSKTTALGSFFMMYMRIAILTTPR